MNPRMTRTLLALASAWLISSTALAGPVPRIIGGTDSGNGEFPFMAALVQSAAVDPMYANDHEAQFCGGTVVAARWVLTAAHCVEGMSNNNMQVITGVTTLATAAPFATRTNVAAILPHPLYDEDKITNDIAMLYLATPVATSAAFSIDDGTAAAALTDGSLLTAIGWGIADQGVLDFPDDDVFKATLQKAVLDFIPQATCNSGTYYGGTLHASAVCAGFLSDPPRSGCFGDSGGPLMVAMGGGQYRQVGVTSYGTSVCADMFAPGVWVNVGRYTGFVMGAQTQPDIRANISTVPGSVNGFKVRARIVSSNGSPVTAAAGVSLVVSINGNTGITDADDFSACGTATTGTGDGMVTTITCNLGSIAAGSGNNRELEMNLYGDGAHSVTASVSTTSGDYYSPNNSALRNFTPGPILPTVEEDAAGNWPLLAVLPLLLLGLRRRHATRRIMH